MCCFIYIYICIICIVVSLSPGGPTYMLPPLLGRALSHKHCCSLSEGGMIRLEARAHRAQMSQFEPFELVPLSKVAEQFSIEQFEATASRSTVPSPPLLARSSRGPNHRPDNNNNNNNSSSNTSNDNNDNDNDTSTKYSNINIEHIIIVMVVDSNSNSNSHSNKTNKDPIIDPGLSQKCVEEYFGVARRPSSL